MGPGSHALRFVFHALQARPAWCAGYLCGMQLRAFTFNPFQENTYVLWDASGEALVVDPGMLHPDEHATLQQFLTDQGVRPVQVVLTHAHLDHIFGCPWLAQTYGLAPWLHPDAVAHYRQAPQQALMFGMPSIVLPAPAGLLDTTQPLRFGQTELALRHTPGHAPGHVVLIHHATRQVVVGDVLFQGSIGRTDLPGGNHALLLQSIFQELLTLPDDYAVHAGHMGPTTIGHERRHNPFLTQS